MKYLSLLFFLFTLSANGQVENRRTDLTLDLPEFFLDALSFYSGDSIASRVDLYVQVPYDAMQFVKDGAEFVARYEITMYFMSLNNEIISEKLWNEEIRTEDFAQTEDRTAYNLTQRSIILTPGIYSLRTQLKDQESKKISTIIRKVIVGNYVTRAINLSDLMLIKKVSLDGERRNIVPNISGNIGESSNTFYLFFEIYNTVPDDPLEIHYLITDGKGRQVLDKRQEYIPKSGRTQIIAKFDSTDYATGAYTVSVEVVSQREKHDVIPVLKQKGFFVRWGNMPLSINDLDEAVLQLRYIAKEKEFDAIEEAPNEGEKRRLFEEFWKRRDPSPDTKRNEFMEEYYQRVEYANRHFSHYIAGWRTDMGMVFIIFGSPNNVERHPFDIDAKPYEIWSYYDYNRQVIFVDETGFGDYRLLTPIYDMLQRLKLY